MVKLAPHLGFCFGVRRSVEIVDTLLKKGEKIYTLGDIIHNKKFCDSLKLKGVSVATEEDIPKLGSKVNLILRAHGVGPDVYDMCKKFQIKCFDATCPFVKRIHRIVFKQSEIGRTILILGDENHPEVRAIKKYCVGEVYVFSNFEEVETFLTNRVGGDFVLVAQTTYSSILWEQGLQKVDCFANLKIFNTICAATVERQNAAIKLSKEVDFMIVIGDRNSSNSRKLFKICSEFCKACFVESRLEIERVFLLNQIKNKIGIVAGASTPPYLIKEIYEFVKCNVNN